MKLNLFFSILFIFLFSGCFFDENEAVTETDTETEEVVKTINIYSDRHYPIDDTIYNTFERLHGVRVNLVKGKSEDLLARIEKEAKATEADLLITSDAGRLVQAKNAGFFQELPALENETFLPKQLIDTDRMWIGLTKRARVIVYHKDRVDSSDLSTYEDLINEKWNGKISVRSKENIYNQSLLASIIAHNGEEKALEWVKGVVANMSREPKGNDRDQIKQVHSGAADVAIVNTYYVGKMINSDDEGEREAIQNIGVFYPNQEGRGAHINVSGVGFIKWSEKTDLVQKFVNFLLSEQMQKHYANANYEFPAHKDVEINETIAKWGSFKEDDIPLTKIGELNTQAIKTFDKGGWK
jgi:iron(III) transport system substrate-binding protein